MDNKYKILLDLNNKILENHRCLSELFTSVIEFSEDETQETLEVLVSKMQVNELKNEELKKEILKLIKTISEN